jgi:hypothetical protein
MSAARAAFTPYHVGFRLKCSAFKLTRRGERSDAIHRGEIVGQPEGLLGRHGFFVASLLAMTRT